MYKSFLSHYQLKKYMAIMLKNNLVKFHEDEHLYKITEKGVKFLQLFTNINHRRRHGEQDDREGGHHQQGSYESRRHDHARHLHADGVCAPRTNPSVRAASAWFSSARSTGHPAGRCTSHWAPQHDPAAPVGRRGVGGRTGGAPQFMLVRDRRERLLMPVANSAAAPADPRAIDNLSRLSPPPQEHRSTHTIVLLVAAIRRSYGPGFRKQRARDHHPAGERAAEPARPCGCADRPLRPRCAGLAHRGPSTSSTIAFKSSGSNGFATNRSAPASSTSSRACVQAVTTTTGIVPVTGSACRAESTSRPLVPGSITSSAIRSGWSSRASSSASRPSTASAKR